MKNILYLKREKRDFQDLKTQTRKNKFKERKKNPRREKTKKKQNKKG